MSEAFTTPSIVRLQIIFESETSVAVQLKLTVGLVRGAPCTGALRAIDGAVVSTVNSQIPDSLLRVPSVMLTFQ